MNILYLCADPGIPIRGTKGAAIHVRSLIDAFDALGHRVTLITPRLGEDPGPEPAARIITVPGSVDKNLSAAERETRSIEIAELVFRSARALTLDERFDFIYERYSLWSDAGARLARETGLQLVVEVNAPLRIEAARYRRLDRDDLATEIESRLFTTATAIAVVSNPLCEYVTQRGASAECIHVLPNAVDERFFHPAVSGDLVRSELDIADRFVVGFVGTAKPWHDLDTLVAAFARFKESNNCASRLVLVGEIPEFTRASIAKYGLANDTTIVPPIPNRAVPSYIAAMDVAISPHPAVDNFYFSPLKLFEYMACGVATVAANLAPIAEVVADERTALLFPAGDATALAEKIARLAHDKQLRAHLGWQGASSILQKFTWRQNAQQIVGWLAPTVRKTVTENQTTPIFDERLGAYLFRATRADLAGGLFVAYLGEPFKEVAQIRVLKYKPLRRCVLDYEFKVEPSKHLIGKVFKDDRGALEFTFQKNLWMDGFGATAEDGITIAQPIAFIPEMRMLVQEHAPGKALDDFVGAADFANRVRQSAAAIAKLHMTHVLPSKQYPIEYEVANLERWASELKAFQPDRAIQFAQQLSSLCELASALPNVRLASSHRDFYYGQILFASRRVTLIDLDMIALADPALDVANFVAHLHFLGLQRVSDQDALDNAAAIFVEEYTRRAEPIAHLETFSPRLEFYRAATFFRLMLVVHQRPNWSKWFEPLFEMTESQLRVHS